MIVQHGLGDGTVLIHGLSFAASGAKGSGSFSTALINSKQASFVPMALCNVLSSAASLSRSASSFRRSRSAAAAIVNRCYYTGGACVACGDGRGDSAVDDEVAPHDDAVTALRHARLPLWYRGGKAAATPAAMMPLLPLLVDPAVHSGSRQHEQ